jgi:uncharacterized phiE125 gp8 family phage protein
MSLQVTTGPAAEPLTVGDTITKLHLRVDSADEDALLPLYIAAARRACEQETGQRLINQTLTLYLDEFPDAEINLGTAPVQSITSVKYLDTDGIQQTVASDQYALDSRGTSGWVLPAYGVSWPATRGVANSVEIAFLAGFGASGSSVPEDLKLWMLLHVGHWHNNRASTTDNSMNRLPFAVRLLDPYRIARV